MSVHVRGPVGSICMFVMRILMANTVFYCILGIGSVLLDQGCLYLWLYRRWEAVTLLWPLYIRTLYEAALLF